ncbi:MAG TPA: hypothetical protein VFJ95_04505, partial [Gammaproteobacteria bacterium]|nr:hypothetical protein [Gammaproteobacteria bacterium]
AASAREELILSLADKVLGVRGVRGYFLEHVLRSIEDAANAWLLRLCGNHGEMRLSLSPQSEKVAGGVRDVIAMKVSYGGGTYQSSSRGERRRVDVAMMLATAQLHDESHDGEARTLWFDEPFDALDPAGVEAAATVLQELAERQPVVVISHNEQLVRLLRPEAHYKVAGGRVRKG